MGNPFADTGTDMYNLDTKDVASDEVVKTVNNIQARGEAQYSEYVQKRLVDRSFPLSTPIKRNKFCLFGTAPLKKSSAHFQIATLKNNCSLFARLYVSSTSRGGDIDDFFSLRTRQPPLHSLATE